MKAAAVECDYLHSALPQPIFQIKITLTGVASSDLSPLILLIFKIEFK